jgi:hypothetical protein
MRGEDKRGERNEAPKGRRRARGGVLFRGRRVSCQDVAHTVWPQSAARESRGMGTRRGAVATPVSSRTRGAVAGDVTGQGSAGRLAGRMPK